MSFRRVYWSFPSVSCPRCGVDAQRLWGSSCVAVDIDLDQPIVLVVEGSVHVLCSLRPSPRISETRFGSWQTRQAVGMDSLEIGCLGNHELNLEVIYEGVLPA